MSYRIGSFNLKNIGKGAITQNTDRDMRTIAQIIKERFDVVALQEVLCEGAAIYSKKNAERALIGYLGSDWDFRWAEAESSRYDPRYEGYAFVWNKRRLQLSSVQLNNGTTRIFQPRVCRLNRLDMIRRPFYARFTPVGTGGSVPWIELRLLCVHTYWGNDDDQARDIRNKELEVLIKDIYPQISDRRYGNYGNGMPSYTVLMGDYNVQLRRSWKEKLFDEENTRRVSLGKAKITKEPPYLKTDLAGDVIETTRWGHRYIKTVQDQLTTLKSKYDGEYDDEKKIRGYSRDYDHFSYEEKQFEGIEMRVRRIDAVRRYYNDDFAAFRKKVSDHIPILMDIEFKGSFNKNQSIDNEMGVIK